MATLLLVSCAGPEAGAPGLDASVTDDAGRPVRFRDVTGTHLPSGIDGVLSLDVQIEDYDGDGDLDIFIAHEIHPNLLYINDGTGHFRDESDQRLPRTVRDSEDVGVADFDGDGDLDIMIVSEDDQENELYLNDGRGAFARADDRIPVTGTSNAIAVAELTGDGTPDVIIGNNGQNFFLAGDGEGGFIDETAARLPLGHEITQDLILGDVDGDGDLDLLTANEDQNRLYLNDGRGFFTDESEARLVWREGVEESRAVDLADVDGDGDLDIVYGNVSLANPGASCQNRLLLNEGGGFFVDATGQLPPDIDFTMDADFIDIDGDGDYDLLTANYGDERRGRGLTPYRIYQNDGAGRFQERTGDLLPDGTTGHGFDVEFADLDGDGLPDLYLASGRSTDRLLLRE